MSPKGREHVSILLPKPHQPPDHCWLRAKGYLQARGTVGAQLAGPNGAGGSTQSDRLLCVSCARFYH